MDRRGDLGLRSVGLGLDSRPPESLGGSSSPVLALERPLRKKSVGSKVLSLAVHAGVVTLVVVIPLLRVTNTLPEMPVMMAFVNPGYLDILIENPMAKIMTIGCLVALVAAHFVIRKIVDIKL